jgi:hypothetical protein
MPSKEHLAKYRYYEEAKALFFLENTQRLKDNKY